jgi:hypothetical protein
MKNAVASLPSATRDHRARRLRLAVTRFESWQRSLKTAPIRPKDLPSAVPRIRSAR